MTQVLTSLLPFALLALLWVGVMSHVQRRRSSDSRVERPELQAERLEDRNRWSPGGALHIYRDPEAFGENSVGPRFLIACFLFLLLGAQVAIHPRVTWFDALLVAFCVGGLVAVAVHFGRERDGNCGEIRLSDEGTCELETRRRVIRLHVGEIQSVTYWRDSENEGEHYTIHYRGGKLGVTQRMKGFLDFLTRLKALNPAVDLSSFPAVLADTWPGVGGPGTGERIARGNRFTRSALFPLIVVALLVYLASQTLVK